MFIARMLRLALLTLSGVAAATFVAVATMRLLYPLELHPIEGLLLDHAALIAGNEQIYVPPSSHFVPLAMMPGYPALVAMLVKVFGAHLWEARLLSLLATLGSALLVAWIVRAETQRWTLGAAGAGLFLASYGLTGAQADVGSPHAMMLFLVVLGYVLIREEDLGALGTAAAAVSLSAALFVHQQAAWFIGAALVAIILRRPRRLLLLLPALAAAGVVGYGLALMRFGDSFTEYAWKVPLHWIDLDPVRLMRVLSDDLFGVFGIAAVLGLMSFTLPRDVSDDGRGLWVWMAVAATGVALTANLDPMAGRGALMPLALALCILGPLSIDDLVQRLTSWPATGLIGQTVVMAALVIQFLPLVYDPRPLLPPSPPREYDAFIARLKAHHGPIVVPSHGHLAWLAGKGIGFHLQAVRDLERARANGLDGPAAHALDSVLTALRAGPGRPALLLDEPLAESKTLSSLAHVYRLESEPATATARARVRGRFPRLPAYLYVPVDTVAETVPVAADTLDTALLSGEAMGAIGDTAAAARPPS